MSRRIWLFSAILAALIITVGLVADHHETGEMKGQQGKIQLVFVITAPAELVDQGRAIWADHAVWMEKTHHREGEKALLRYNLSTAPELSNPLDPTSEPTGRVNFILAEVYESPAGVADHFDQAQGSWAKFSEMQEWMGKCDAVLAPAAEIVHSLW